MVKLRQLLLSDDVRHHIDYVSDNKTSSNRASNITWERLFSQAATLVFREVDHRVKPSTSRRSSSQGASVGTKVPVVFFVVCTCTEVL